MSRRSVSAPVLLCLAAASILLLSGCAQKSPSASASPTPPSASAVPGAPSTPTPVPTPTFVPAKYTCNSILPPATLAVFQSRKKDGFTPQLDYVQRVHNFDPNLSLFDDYGGILCQWAYPNASKQVDYGFSSITAAQATTEQAYLQKNGYTPTQKDNGTVYANADIADFPDTYLFIDGYWFYASQTSLLDLIVENVFAVPGE
jgi:hypothetical protein